METIPTLRNHTLGLGGHPSATAVHAGVHRAQHNYQQNRRILPLFELIVVSHGILRMTEDNTEYEVQPRQWLLLRPGRVHFSAETMPNDLEFHWLCFALVPTETARPATPTEADAAGTTDLDQTDGERQTDALRHPVGLRQAEGLRQFGTLRRPERLTALIEDLIEDQEHEQLGGHAAAGYVALALAEIALSPVSALGPATPPLAGQATAYISQRLADPSLSTASIARVLHCHPDHLGRVFRASYGESVVQHIHQSRVALARRLLRTTSWSTDRIAVESGFRDPRYFTRVFTRYAGLTPATYKLVHPGPATPL